MSGLFEIAVDYQSVRGLAIGNGSLGGNSFSQINVDKWKLQVIFRDSYISIC